MKVCKFGGTSMATAAAINRVKKIILSDKERRFVVVSAPGKRYSHDTKVTDLLYAAYAEKCEKGSCSNTMSAIRARFVELCADLGVKADINKYLDEVEKGINESTSADYAASRGEYLSAVVVSEVLGFEMVDAADVIKFKHDGTFDAELTNR